MTIYHEHRHSMPGWWKDKKRKREKIATSVLWTSPWIWEFSTPQGRYEMKFFSPFSPLFFPCGDLTFNHYRCRAESIWKWSRSSFKHPQLSFLEGRCIGSVTGDVFVACWRIRGPLTSSLSADKFNDCRHISWMLKFLLTASVFVDCWCIRWLLT